MIIATIVLAIVVPYLFVYWKTHRLAPIGVHHQPPATRTSTRKRPTSDLLQLRAKTAFVTGAAGFLGSNLVDQLLLDGWKVTALVRDGSPLAALSQWTENANLVIVRGDVTDKNSLRKVVPKDVAVLFHVAAIVSPWNGKAGIEYKVNVLGTRNVIDIALEKNVQKLIHTSTCSVYQGPGDEGVSVINELTPHYGLAHWWAYAYTKTLAELEVRAAIEDADLFAVIMNPAAIVGKYDINGFARTARVLKSGQLPFVPDAQFHANCVSDIARAHIVAAERGRLGRNYNLCGTPVSFSKLVELVGNAIGIDGKKPSVASHWLYPVGMVNELIALWTGKEPDLSLDILLEFGTRDMDCPSTRAIRELDYKVAKSTDDLKQCIQESMDYLKKIDKL